MKAYETPLLEPMRTAVEDVLTASGDPFASEPDYWMFNE